MATYPIKMMIDESGQPFVPLTSLDAVVGEKKLQYILDATEKSAGHFQIISKELKMTDLINTIIVVRWPNINSTVKPSYLQINEEEEKPLYNGSGTEYLSLDEASNTVNMLAYDGNKWILTSGAGSSGSGHVITNEAGETMEQQKILNFVGFQVENDGANRLTRITNPEPINNLTTSESGLGSLDAYQGKILSQRSVPVGGTKGQVLAKSGNEDHQLEWINTAGDNAINGDGSITKLISLTYEEYKALEAAGEIEPTVQYYITDFSEVNKTLISEEEIADMIQQAKNEIAQEQTRLNSEGTLVRLSNLTYTDTETWTFHEIEFTDEWGWNGNGYIINDKNGATISIGDDVSLVEVTGWVTILQTTIGGAVEVGITVNGKRTGMMGFGTSQYLGNTTTYYTPPLLCSVSKGDTFGLFFCNSTASETVLYAEEGRPSIGLKVKVIK